jgi:hypothetical protein
MPPGARYVGRPGPFGNQFTVADHGPEGAVERHREWFHEPEQAWFRAHVRRHLRGLDLACWCPADQACHATALLEVANS